MKTLNYKIKILSDWHIGSGLDSATNVDTLVLKNELQLPYIPGKTIKGLIKDAVQDMIDVGQVFEIAMIRIFGKPIKDIKLKKEELTKIFGDRVKDIDLDDDESQISIPGSAFFENAILPETDFKDITKNNLSSFLYRNIASTAIGENGVALEKSLRVSEVTTPLSLEGTISGLHEEDYKLLTKAILLVRHLGVNRNRGLGRCQFSIPKKTES